LPGPTHFLVGAMIEKSISDNAPKILRVPLILFLALISHGLLDYLSKLTYHPPDALFHDWFWLFFHIIILILSIYILIKFGAKYSVGMIFSVFPDLDWAVNYFSQFVNLNNSNWETPILHTSLYPSINSFIPEIHQNLLPDLRLTGPATLVEFFFIGFLLSLITTKSSKPDSKKDKSNLFKSLGLAPILIKSKPQKWHPSVQFSGFPSYISEFQNKFRDNGGPLSPYGSHIGLKADIENLRLGSVRHYAALTGKHLLDYSQTGLIGISSIGIKMDGNKLINANSREISFDGLSWMENAKFDGLRASIEVAFDGLNKYSFKIDIRNLDQQAVTVNPYLHFNYAGRTEIEAGGESLGSIKQIFRVSPTISGRKGLLTISSSSDLIAEKLSKKEYFYEVDNDLVTLQPLGTITSRFNFHFSVDEINDEKKSLVENKRTPTFGKTEIRRPDEILNALPKPHFPQDEVDYTDLYHMSVLALENALYAPRNNMNYWGCVPSKVHYNWFWLWDTGFQSLGYSEYKPKISKEVVRTIFETQRNDGFIPHMTNDQVRRLTAHSQSPVFGYTMLRMTRRYHGSDEFNEFVRDMYPKHERYLNWWFKSRDRNQNGLLEYLSVDEGGGDNSPRSEYFPKLLFINYFGYLGELIGSRIKPLDSVELNSWIYLYQRAMSEWAMQLGFSQKALIWDKKSLQLANQVDSYLWNSEYGCWFDSYGWIWANNRQHFKTLTPSIWFPAFAGATKDANKAKQVIERHLLNINEFWGEFPIPSVAYNDPFFDPKIPGWTGSIWIFYAYIAMETLFKYGYDAEARELRNSILGMISNQGKMKGIFETYDPLTGKYKNDHSDGYYCAMHFGWSASFVLEMILERYQEDRFIFDDTKEISGFIRHGELFITKETYYRVYSNIDVPFVKLYSIDDNPLVNSKKIAICLSDPYGSFSEKVFNVWIKSNCYTIYLDELTELDIS
jgi:hypothetical protein